jgi:hypothetical protein
VALIRFGLDSVVVDALDPPPTVDVGQSPPTPRRGQFRNWPQRRPADGRPGSGSRVSASRLTGGVRRGAARASLPRALTHGCPPTGSLSCYLASSPPRRRRNVTPPAPAGAPLTDSSCARGDGLRLHRPAGQLATWRPPAHPRGLGHPAGSDRRSRFGSAGDLRLMDLTAAIAVPAEPLAAAVTRLEPVIDRRRFARCRLHTCTCTRPPAPRPPVKTRRNVPSVEGARTPSNSRPIPPWRSRSRSSIESAPQTIPAMMARIFAAAFAPPAAAIRSRSASSVPARTDPPATSPPPARHTTRGSDRRTARRSRCGRGIVASSGCLLCGLRWTFSKSPSEERTGTRRPRRRSRQERHHRGGCIVAGEATTDSDPNPRVSDESIFELAWRSSSGVNSGYAQAESPSVASGGGSPWCRGRDGLVRALRVGRGCGRGPR